MNEQDLQQRLQKQIDAIDLAIAKARQNEVMDISFIDDEVVTICQEIVHGDKEAAKLLEPKMIEMINRLDELSVELKEYQDRIKPEN